MSSLSNPSLRTRLLLLVLLVTLPLLGLVLVNSGLQRAHETVNVADRAQTAAALAASDVTQRLHGQKQLLVALAQLPAVTGHDAANCVSAAGAILAKFQSFTNIGAADGAGNIFCSAVALTQTTNVAQRNWFSEAVATGDFALGDYQYSALTGRPVVVGAYPVRDAAGAVQAVVFAALDLTQLNTVGQVAALPADASVTVIDNSGTVLSRYPDPAGWVGQRFPADPLFMTAAAQSSGTARLTSRDNITSLYGFAAINDPVAGLHVAVGLPTDAAFAEVNNTLARSLAGLALVTIIVLVVARIAADAFVLHPLRGLLTLTRQFAAGNLGARSNGPYRAGELDELALSFDSMAVAIQQREAQLEHTNRLLQTLSECNQALVRSQDEAALLAAVCRTIVTFGGYRLAWVELADADGDAAPSPAVAQPAWQVAAQASASGEAIPWPAGTVSRPAQSAAQAGQPLAVRLTDAGDDPAWSTHARQAGYQVLLALPMVHDGQTLGVLCIATAESAGFGASEEQLLAELSGDLAYGLAALRTRAAHLQAEAEIRSLNASLEQRVAERTAALEREVAERARAQAEVEDLYNSAPCGYHSLDRQGKFVRVNDYEAQLFGRAREALVGKLTLGDVLTPAGREIFNRDYPRFLESGTARNVELEVLRPDGSVVPVLASASQVQNEQGEFVMTRSTLLDISDRKQAEGRIQALNETLSQRATELEATNRELEAFSYSVSHDLRAPLRSIDGFSLALVEDYGAQLSGSAQDYLGRVRQAAQRMSVLIDDLLNLSRVTRSELRLDQVDLSALAASIAAELQAGEPARPAEFVIAPGQTARGDQRLLGILLTNLLGNAWKFTGQRELARIEFGASGPEKARIFFVRDNGAGFDMAYVQRLFGAFQRLHDSSQFPGSGIGLATVQRIVHRHGGTAWAEAQLNQGATFFFTLGHRNAG
jgi:PAS domain S-box-containing protein